MCASFKATVGYAVGLGNVWRFPYLAQKNGGGAFLIPYLIMLLIEGLPIFLLELTIGQRLRKGSIGAWHRVSPYLGGIGIASAVVSLNVALYYNTVIAWCLYYFGKVSFQCVFSVLILIDFVCWIRGWFLSSKYVCLRDHTVISHYFDYYKCRENCRAIIMNSLHDIITRYYKRESI